jgi:hypothetical protein
MYRVSKLIVRNCAVQTIVNKWPNCNPFLAFTLHTSLIQILAKQSLPEDSGASSRREKKLRMLVILITGY